jgi:hypothetical protein
LIAASSPEGDSLIERAVSDDLALGVLHLLGLSGQAVLDLLTDYLCYGGQHWTRHSE